MRNRILRFVAVCTVLLALGRPVAVGATLSYTEVARLTESSPASGDAFGSAVAMYGDWLAVGAPNATAGGNNGAGAVFLFHRSGLDWTLAATLSAQDGAANDHFGKALTMGDGVLAVGAPNADVSGATDAGAVYLFTYSNNAWSQSQKLTAPTPTANDTFGAAVALAGNTLAVGTPMADLQASNAGAVFVFVLSGGSWSHQATLTASDGSSGDHLGAAVTAYGDRVAAGAADANGGGLTDSGKVYLFLRQGTTWSQEAILTAGDAAANDTFGAALALDDSLLAIGAPGADVNAQADRGAVYVFSLNEGRWSQTAKLTTSDGAAGDAFGQALALRAGLLLAGAPLADGNNTADVGAAYVFSTGGSAWSQEARLDAANAAGGDAVGQAVALDGGWLTLGLPGADAGGAADAGAVALFAPAQARAVVQIVSAQGLIVRPRDILFTPVMPLGVDVTIQAADQTWTAANRTGLGVDWHITLAATDFSDGNGHTIPVANFKVQMAAADITTVSGNTAPASQVSAATALSNGGITLLSASNGAGQGVYDFVPHFSLTVPAGTSAGRYQTVVTVTTAAGP